MTDLQEIEDILKAAYSYSSHLKVLQNQLQNAEQQIKQSSEETEHKIDRTFNNLISNLTKVLLAHKNSLIERVKEIRGQSLVPLEECTVDVCGKLKATNEFVIEGRDLMEHKKKNVHLFQQKSSFLGSLPEIPELKEVPFLTFQYDNYLEQELLDSCSQLGKLYTIAPIQISQLSEKPGAILVEYQIIENEGYTDIQAFKLQRAFGDVTKQTTANFFDCYEGIDNQCLLKDLLPNQNYSFRVCCMFDGSKIWSPWSVIQVGATTIKPYSWAPNEDFILTNDNKIACPIKKAPTLLISNGPQIAVGYSIEFTYLEFDKNCSAIGLIVSESSKEITTIKPTQLNHFILESTGEIFVDGVKKSTKLPESTKNEKISFLCELIQNDKVRIHIETCEKRVTYDWPISINDKIYFIASLESPSSKIMVE